jgi:hypothetical protein
MASRPEPSAATKRRVPNPPGPRHAQEEGPGLSYWVIEDTRQAQPTYLANRGTETWTTNIHNAERYEQQGHAEDDIALIDIVDDYPSQHIVSREHIDVPPVAEKQGAPSGVVTHDRMRDVANNQGQTFLGALIHEYVAQQEQASRDAEALRKQLADHIQANEQLLDANKSLASSRNEHQDNYIYQLNRADAAERKTHRGQRTGARQMSRLDDLEEMARSAYPLGSTLLQLIAVIRAAEDVRNRHRGEPEEWGDFDEALENLERAE